MPFKFYNMKIALDTATAIATLYSHNNVFKFPFENAGSLPNCLSLSLLEVDDKKIRDI